MESNGKPTGLNILEVIQAIENGKKLRDFEVTWGTYRLWHDLGDQFVPYSAYGSNPVFRLKVKTHEINGFTVPVAMTSEPEEGTEYWLINFRSKELVSFDTWDGYAADLNPLKNGVCFSTKEAAVANAKAMLGIDPDSP